MTFRPWAAALCGYYGFGNLGDELLAEALVRGMEECGVPRERLVILSAAPERSARELGVASVDRWSFREVWGALRRSETLLLGGGGLFQDVTSLRSVLYYAGMVHLARMAGCRPWAFGQSVGPLKSWIGRALARRSLGRCAFRGVRDAPSEALLRRWGMECRRSPDGAFLLADEGGSSRAETGKDLLVNLRPWGGSLSRDCAKIAATEASRRRLSLVGVALAPEDERVLEDLRRDGVFPCTRVVTLTNLVQARELFGGAAMAVGMRLHFLVISAVMCRPAVAVPYDPKVESFARDWSFPVWYGEGPLPEPGGAEKDPGDARQEVKAALESAWLASSKEEKRREVEA